MTCLGGRTVATDGMDGMLVLGPDAVLRIVIPAKATDAERFAAAELQRYVRQMTGRDLTVTDDQAPALSGLPADESVSCEDVPPPASPSAVDDCDPAPSVKWPELNSGEWDCVARKDGIVDSPLYGGYVTIVNKTKREIRLSTL